MVEECVLQSKEAYGFPHFAKFSFARCPEFMDHRIHTMQAIVRESQVVHRDYKTRVECKPPFKVAEVRRQPEPNAL